MIYHPDDLVKINLKLFEFNDNKFNNNICNNAIYIKSYTIKIQ